MTIFVQIASYRDPECQWTVKDLFEKATYPERIHVGICWQHVQGEDDHCFKVPAPYPDQIRVIDVDAKESGGVCWARRETQKLWQNEEYTLVIDSHIRFVPGWDEKMLLELAQCDSPKAILTCHPASYTPPNTLEDNPKCTFLRGHMYNDHGDIRFRGEFLDRVPDKPLNGAFIAAGFMFSKAEVIEEVPYDPYLYFNQEEVSMAVRFYTHGWDVHSSSSSLLYHYYGTAKDGPKRPLHWEDNKEWLTLQTRARTRLDHLLEVQKTNDQEAIKELDIYGLGSTRTLDEFIAYSGLDVRHKNVTERALRAEFIRGLAQWKNNQVYVPEIDTNGPIPFIKPVVTSDTLPPLESGDFIPFFTLPDQGGND